MIDGIIYRHRTGVAWRDLPADFGPWQTVWKRHRRYALDRLWDRLTRLIGIGLTNAYGACRSALLDQSRSRPHHGILGDALMSRYEYDQEASAAWRMDVVHEVDDAAAPVSRWVDAMRRLNTINDPLARKRLALNCDCGSGTGSATHSMTNRN